MTRSSPILPGEVLTLPAPDQLQEYGFRRGYQQGAEALAFALGVSKTKLLASSWGRRITAWRDRPLSRQEEPPHWITPAELAELTPRR